MFQGLLRHNAVEECYNIALSLKVCILFWGVGGGGRSPKGRSHRLPFSFQINTSTYFVSPTLPKRSEVLLTCPYVTYVPLRNGELWMYE